MEELGGGDGVTWWDNPLGTHCKNLQLTQYVVHVVHCVSYFLVAVTTDLTETKEERLVFSLGYRGFSPWVFGSVDSEPRGTDRA